MRIRRSSLLSIALLLLTACSSLPALAEAPAQNSQPLVTESSAQPTAASPDPTASPEPAASPTLPAPPVIVIPPTASPTSAPSAPINTLLFTGAIVPGRCVQAAIEQRGQADYLYKGVRELIGEADLAVGTLNAALSDYPPSTGCVETFVLVGGSINADAMAGAGFDLLSVATNHIKNCGLTACGERAFLDTLENLNRVGILPVGAGLNLAQALQPVIVTSNGIRFGFVSLGEIEARAFAGESQPGIAPLNDENLMAAITAAREQADVVVVLPHWGSDYSFTPNYRQRHFARIAQQAGADLVVGNHSHVIQGMQEIEGMPVFYSLGSFVFDQTWLLEGESEPVLQQGLMLRVTFEGTEVLSSEVIPVHIADDKSGQVQIADPVEAAKILERFQSISEALE